MCQHEASVVKHPWLHVFTELANEKTKIVRQLTELDSITQDKADFVHHWNRLLETAKQNHSEAKGSVLEKEKLERVPCPNWSSAFHPNTAIQYIRSIPIIHHNHHEHHDSIDTDNADRG